MMEIGVFNGDNARTMVKVAIENYDPEEVEYYGFDLFRGYRLNHVREKLIETGCRFKLFKGDSVVTLPENMGTLPKMDLIFIDGGHSYETVKCDWKYSKVLMHDETAVFFHNVDYSGPRRVVGGISRERYRVKSINTDDDYETALVKKKL